MKKYFKTVLLMLLSFAMIILSSCGNDSASVASNLPGDADISSSKTENEDKYRYIGNFEQEPVYQKLKEIENCTDPDTLCDMLSELYGEEISYVKMTYKNKPESETFNGYEAPYEDFYCFPIVFYNFSNPLCKPSICSDTYLFFKPYNEKPLFAMDCDGTYIVGEYKVTEISTVSCWVILDLFMCLHKYIDTDEAGKNTFSDAVRYMDFYLELENLIVDGLSGNNGSIDKTKSLNPSIDILSVNVKESSQEVLRVKYRINNISEKRGAVYLKFSNHAYTDMMHFNDKSYKNDLREDGCYEYDIIFSGTGSGRLTITYGYGDFDANTGWDKKIKATVSVLFASDYGEISSSNTPQDEIKPLYCNDEYIGAWTANESAELVEINGNSTSIPFEKHSFFYSEDGHKITVKTENGTPSFSIDGVPVGKPTDSFTYEGVTAYDLLYNNVGFSITRYPNDRYIRVQNAYQFFDEGDICLYPQDD